jgi:hypothetical protein
MQIRARFLVFAFAVISAAGLPQVVSACSINDQVPIYQSRSCEPDLVQDNGNYRARTCYTNDSPDAVIAFYAAIGGLQHDGSHFTKQTDSVKTTIDVHAYEPGAAIVYVCEDLQ